MPILTSAAGKDDYSHDRYARMTLRKKGYSGGGGPVKAIFICRTALIYCGNEEEETFRLPASRSVASHPMNPTKWASLAGNSSICSDSQY